LFLFKKKQANKQMLQADGLTKGKR